MEESLMSGVRSALVIGCLFFIDSCSIIKLLFEVQIVERHNEE